MSRASKERVVWVGEGDFAETAREAEASPRRRMNRNLHLGDGDICHRFLNVLLEGTYVRPHAHVKPPKSETFIVLRGAIAVFIFDDAGALIEARRLAANEPGVPVCVDLLPGVVHSVTALTHEAVCFEVKPGPYDGTDKVMAAWAPDEGTSEAEDALREWKRGVR